ncbi:MAG: tetratricopeptide repeat protein [Bacteriovoracaceae bacterium]|nr:tetratricopeptide repeat protein [Bacteriovoracaceae bacterium]
MRVIICLKLMLLVLLVNGCSSPKHKNPRLKKADLYYSQGSSELLHGDYTNSLKHLIKANTLDPDNTKILNNLGMAYYFKGEKTLAKKNLKKALDVDKQNSDARNNLASIYLKMGKYSLAEQEYKKIRSHLTYSKQFRVLFNMATISLKRNRISEAMERLNLSLNDKKDFCPAHLLLGNIHYKNRDYKNAYKSYVKASLTTCYSYPIPHYKQAVTLIKLGEYMRAKDKLNHLIKKHPDTRFSKLAREKLANLTPRVILGLDKIGKHTIHDEILELPEESVKTGSPMAGNKLGLKKKNKTLFITPTF